MNTIVKHAAINALATAVYVGAVGAFLFYVPTMFRAGKPATALIPIAMLLLFVFSAAFTGALIFGRPALWYLEGRKQEALYLLVLTLGIFLMITVATLLVLLAIG